MPPKTAFRVEPLTPERWDDLVELFGTRGACGGCWCMTPRLTRAEYEKHKGDGNKRKLRALVARTVPGVLAYVGARPVGWCAIEPRTEFPALSRSRILAPLDDQPVWSIVCLFVRKELRRQGISSRLVEGAVAHAKRHGARLIEAYPVEPKQDPMPDVFAYTGTAATFLRAGFREVLRRSPTRPIMRRAVRSR
ncbi:MAG: GNAT family N-acetyltransferase [Phycisphaerales bacterium]|nr:GNAT family N-acetyltransferase [Phycisphaerales bacterium]